MRYNVAAQKAFMRSGATRARRIGGGGRSPLPKPLASEVSAQAPRGLAALAAAGKKPKLGALAEAFGFGS
jgi:hypothetical protein